MKLAYAELRVTLARLLFAFDIRLADGEDRWDWGEQDTYIFWASEAFPVPVTESNLLIRISAHLTCLYDDDCRIDEHDKQHARNWANKAFSPAEIEEESVEGRG